LPLRDANRCLRSAPAARKLQDSASDPTEGLKRRKDGRIVSTEDDASKRLLELIYRGMFTWLRGLRIHVLLSWAIPILQWPNVT